MVNVSEAKPDIKSSILRLAIILLVFPVCLVYVIPQFDVVSKFYSGDRSYWFHFWIIAVILEWLTIGVVISTYNDRRKSIVESGFPFPPVKRDIVIAIFVLLATIWLTFIGSGGPQDFLERLPGGLQMFIPPSDLSARLFWIFVSLTAAICEETLWRGIAITELRKLTKSTFIAIIISSLSFVFFHGGLQQGVIVFTYRFVIALILAGIYVRTKSLRVPILVHFLMDASALTAIQID